jgi:hypothetical protein
MLKCVVTGGQTGVDRGAQDAALSLVFPCGGWCAVGREAEDGRIPDRYPVRELEKGGYRERTIQNVLDSDGTLIIYCGALSGGTEQTQLHCIRRKKPYKLIDAREISVTRATELGLEFVDANLISVLNVAGPRESSWDGAAQFAEEVVGGVLRSIRKRNEAGTT